MKKQVNFINNAEEAGYGNFKNNKCIEIQKEDSFMVIGIRNEKITVELYDEEYNFIEEIKY